LYPTAHCRDINSDDEQNMPEWIMDTVRTNAPDVYNNYISDQVNGENANVSTHHGGSKVKVMCCQIRQVLEGSGDRYPWRSNIGGWCCDVWNVVGLTLKCGDILYL